MRTISRDILKRESEFRRQFIEKNKNVYNAYIKDYLTLIENYRSVQFKKYKNKADCMAALEDTSKEVKKILNKKYQKKYLEKAEKVKAG